MTERKIIHVDMDCFYAAVEVKHRPDLKGLPLGIGGPPNSRSVLCTASYEARKFGVKSAMPVSQALRLCPQLVLIPPNFPLYKKESQLVRGIFDRYTTLVEPLSLDEAFLDVSGTFRCRGSASQIAEEIRFLIRKELNLSASAGIAPNKFLAKIASDWNKPNGQFVIKPSEVDAFIKDLPVEKLFGVGKVTAAKMHSLGLKTCGDIQKQTLFQLAHWFGSRAQELSELSRGIDNRKVDPHSERKSLTVEETFNNDLTSLRDCLRHIPPLYKDWEERILKYHERDRIRGFVVKVKYSDFKSSTHEVSNRGWPSILDFENLFSHLWEKRPDPVRLIGLGVRLASEDAKKESNQLSFAM